MMRRREFIAGLGGAVTLPLGARAQQPNHLALAHVNADAANYLASLVGFSDLIGRKLLHLLGRPRLGDSA